MRHWSEGMLGCFFFRLIEASDRLIGRGVSLLLRSILSRCAILIDAPTVPSVFFYFSFLFLFFFSFPPCFYLKRVLTYYVQRSFLDARSREGINFQSF